MDAERFEEATLAGGCFWCLEAVFNDLRGVKRIVPGYTGGSAPNPTYERVCAGGTGHAEAVRVVYDPELLTYRDLLAVFFAVHDPTSKDRQGADVGTQYRSAIFYHTPAQKAEAESAIAEAEKACGAPIVTELKPLTAFYPAEDYHWDYFRRNPDQGYCRVVIAPKLEKIRREFPEKIRGAAGRSAERRSE